MPQCTITNISTSINTGDSAYSNEISTGLLAAPTNLSQIAMNGNYVYLAWDDNSALETAYVVEMSTDQVNWTEVEGVAYATNDATDKACTTISGTFTISTPYYFRVSAYSDVLTASSAISNTLTASYTSSSVVTPTNIVATQSTTAFEVEVTWDAVTGAANYDVYRLASDAAQAVYLGTSATTTYLDTAIPADGRYTYQILARDASNTASNLGSAAATDAYFAEGDFDYDGLSNAAEFSLGTDPANHDTDDDGLPDAWEVLYDYEPNNPDSNNNGTPDGSEDNDADGVYNFQEYAAGSDPNTADAGEDDTSSSPDFGNFKLTVGDKSTSLSETWTITAVDRVSGGIAATVTSPLADYASVSETFYAGHTYDIAMTHASGPGDMDWTANVEFAGGNNLPYAIFEEVELDENGKEIKLFGTHLSPDNGYQKTAQLWIPKLDAEIASDVVWANTGDLNENGIIDTMDPKGIPSVNLVDLTVELSQNIEEINLVPTSTTITLTYETSKINVWIKDPSLTRNAAYFIKSGVPISLAQLRTLYGNQEKLTFEFYVEGLEATNQTTSIIVDTWLSGAKWSGKLSDNVELNVKKHLVDIDTDSDNNGEVDRSPAEDAIEDVIDQPGKVILKSNAGSDGSEFAKILLSVATLDLTQLNNGCTMEISADTGLSLWTSRERTALNSYTFPISGNCVDHDRTIYAEGTSSGEHHVYWKLKNASGKTIASDSVKITVVAKELAVSWKTHDGNRALDAEPTAGGLRIFPEKEAPSDTNTKYNYVDLQITLPEAAATDLTVYYKLFDPDNYRNEDKNDTTMNEFMDDDNETYMFIGTEQINYNTIRSITIPKGNHSVIIPLFFPFALAGDNLIAVAGFDQTDVENAALGTDGTSRYIAKVDTESIDQTQLLTVWRTLWIELDRMELPTLPNQPNQTSDGFAYNDRAQYDANGVLVSGQWDILKTPTNEPADFDVVDMPVKPDISTLASAMVDACIVVKEISQSGDTTWVSGENQANRSQGQWDTTAPFGHYVYDTEGDSLLALSLTCCDVNVSDNSFWTVHGIGSYEADTLHDYDATGSAYVGVRTSTVFLVYDETIRDFYMTGNLNDNIPLSISEQYKRVAFHEVLHMFGFDDNEEESAGNAVDIMDWRSTYQVYGGMTFNWQSLTPYMLNKIQSQAHPY